MFFGFWKKQTPPPTLPEPCPDFDPDLSAALYEQGLSLTKRLSQRTATAVDLKGQLYLVRLSPPIYLAQRGEADIPGWGRRSQFLTETSRELDHPGLVPYVRCGNRGDENCLYWIVRRFVKGSALDPLQPITTRNALDLLSQIASALDALHRRGIAHSSLCPNNILLTGDGPPVLTDFGLGHLSDFRTFQEKAESLIYLSPTQIQGTKPTATDDLYALGILAFQLLCKQSPYSAATQDPIKLLMATVAEKPKRLNEIDAGIPEPVVRLVDRLLDKDPQMRTLETGQLVREFRSFKELPFFTAQKQGEELQSLLHNLGTEGSKHSSGRFSLDQIKALEKLRQFQFLNPEDFLLALFAAATPLNCLRVQVTAATKLLEIYYDCPEVSKTELEDLFAQAFSHKGLSHLALGLTGAFRLPKAQVTLCSGPWGCTLTKLGVVQLQPQKPTPGLTVTIRHSGCTIGLEPPIYISQRFRMAPIAIRWNQILLNPQPARTQEDVAVTFPGEEPGLFGMLDGMVFEDRSDLRFAQAQAQAVLVGCWQLDQSYQSLLCKDPTLRDELLHRAYDRLAQLLKEVALEKPVSEQRLTLLESISGSEVYSSYKVSVARRMEELLASKSMDYYHKSISALCGPDSVVQLRPGFLRQTQRSWSEVCELAASHWGHGTDHYWNCLRLAATIDFDQCPSLRPDSSALAELAQHFQKNEP